MTRSELQKEVTAQREWVIKCGGNLEGYLKKYGSASDPDHYGDGGEAIYAADSAYLKELEDRLARSGREPASEYLKNALGLLNAEVTLQFWPDHPDNELLAKLTKIRDQVQAALDLVEEVKNTKTSTQFAWKIRTLL